MSAIEPTAHVTQGIEDKDAVVKLVLEFPGEIPLDYQVSRRCGEAFQPPRADLRQIFSVYGKHRTTSSIIAVSRSDRSLVVFRERISQLAGLAW